MSKNVATLFNVVIVVVLAIAVAGLWEGAEAKAMPSEEAERSALNFLRDLNNYHYNWAQTRPRSDRVRREDDVASTLMKLSQIKQHYSNVGRPRFGKRGSQPGEALDEDYGMMDNYYHWKTR